ncbi:MAG: HAD family hydrolase [Rhodoglobus sp.]
MAETFPSAVLWDMDGTLVDSEPYWKEARSSIATEYGVQWDEGDALAAIGQPLTVSAAIMQRRGVPLDEDELVERVVNDVKAALSRGVVWRPGAPDLLTRLKEEKIPCALVTMAYRPVADAVAGRSPSGVFQVIVSGDEVTQGKPSPEAYLKAAKALGVDPGLCLAIEDTDIGVASALSAGMKVLGVPFLHELTDVPGLVTRSTLLDLTVREIRDMGPVQAD